MRASAVAQRAALVAFAEALSSASAAFRRDECGDPRINGRRGHVYAVSGNFQLFCVCESKKAWTWAKKALRFARVTQDGDDEGMLFLDRLPTPAEAIVIRDYLGIAKRPSLSQDHVARLRVQARRFGDDLRKNPLPATEPHHDLLEGDAAR